MVEERRAPILVLVPVAARAEKAAMERTQIVMTTREDKGRCIVNLPARIAYLYNRDKLPDKRLEVDAEDSDEQ